MARMGGAYFPGDDSPAGVCPLPRLSGLPEVPSAGPALRAGCVLAGVAVTFLTSLAAAALAAVVVAATPLTEQAAAGTLLPLGLACLVAGGGYAAHRARTMGWAHGLAVGLVYVLLALVLQPLLFRSPWTVAEVLRRLALGLAAGTLGGVIGVNL
jgi:putative membrane protein (TIGR04086 family)